MKMQDIGQRLKEELIGERDEFTQVDASDFTNKKYDRVVVRNSISLHAFYIVVAIGLIVFLLVPGGEDKMNIVQLFAMNLFWAMVVTLLPIVLLYFSLRGVLDRTPQLTVDLFGIRTKEWDLPWKEITETKFRFVKGKTTLLIIGTMAGEKRVDIGNTNIGYRFLGHHIELLKKRAK